MVPSAIVTEIQRHDMQDIDATTVIYPLLTAENRRICNAYPWPFTEKFATWTETVGTAGTPLGGSSPQDVRAIRALGMPAVGDNGGNITYLPRDYISKVYGYNSYLLADFPRHYNVWGKNATGGCNVYVFPYIISSMIFAMDYHALPPVLGAGTTEAQMLLPDEFVPILIDRVVARLSRAEGDLQDGQDFDARASSALAEMFDAFDTNQDSPPPMLVTDYEEGWFG